MGFLTRLLSVGGKRKRKGQKGTSEKKAAFSSSTPPLPDVHEAFDEDVLVNRLLRSSSTHFSVISEGTEYRSMPPMPHPINQVLRAPSIMSSATQTDTYTVTVHRRMLHSRTEFPNANRSGDSSPSGSLSRRHSLPPLTPGDKSRLARLRQDASVLSLLDIYDERGNPNMQAFSNTPAKSERHDPSLRALMGTPSTPNLGSARGAVEESDISWADRYLRAARRDSSSSSLTTSSLGIPVNLFKGSLSPDRLRLKEHDSETPFSSCEIDIGIDSMVVERGTVEDTSAILQPLAAVLTSPTKRASQFFNFLQDDTKHHELPPPEIPNASETVSPNKDHAITFTAKPAPPPRGPRPIQREPSSTVRSAADQEPLSHKPPNILFVRNGPKQSLAEVSPPPRQRFRQPSLPSAPSQYQSQVVKPWKPMIDVIDSRAPFEELHNAGASHPSTSNVSAVPESRSVSIASSVHPRIETHRPDIVMDPYTPIPPRPSTDGRRGDNYVGENVPPNAPARPVRGQSRTRTTRNNNRPAKSRENSDLQVTMSSKPVSSETAAASIDHTDSLYSKQASLPTLLSRRTPPATPSKNLSLAHLQAPSHPSPASSSELSPQGRQIMANIRDRARKASHSKKTPRSWQSWGSKSEPAAV